VLRAARQAYGGSGRVIAVMQPHRYTRLAALKNDFATCFVDADTVLIADVYAAGEAPIDGVNRDMLVGLVQRAGHRDAQALQGPGRPAGPDLAGRAAGRRRGLPGRRQHHGVGARAARPVDADRRREGRPARHRQRSLPRTGARMMALETARPHLIDRLPKPRGRLAVDAPLGAQTWFRTGGPAEVLFRPADTEDLASFLKALPADLPVTVLGVGSNLLVRDGGIKGVVIRLMRGFTGITVEGSEVVAGAGALDLNVALTARDHALAGLEFLSGIPGTIGGAFPTNAGAYGGELSDVLVSAEIVDRAGTVRTVAAAQLGLGYRKSNAPGRLDLHLGPPARDARRPDVDRAAHRRDRFGAHRVPAAQPHRRLDLRQPAGFKAWELIERAGCRGLRIGEAQVSEKHCNFLINLGAATAADIESLGEEVRRRVLEQSGVLLHWEIRASARRPAA
jgi:UDP-N-acetylmuramate dehydrogenase